MPQPVRDRAPAPRSVAGAAARADSAAADCQGCSCTTTFPGWTRPDPPAAAVYTTPATSQIYAASSPASCHGLPRAARTSPAGARTGPYLIVFVDAPGPARARSTIRRRWPARRSSVPRPVAIAKASTAAPACLADRSERSAPTSRPGLHHPGEAADPGCHLPRARVVTSRDATAYDWSFTAVGANAARHPERGPRTLSFSPPRRSPIPVGSHEPVAGTRRDHPLPRRSLAPRRCPRAAGRRADTSRGASGFAPFSGCVTIIVTGVPNLRDLTPPVRPAAPVAFRLPVRRCARGRNATLTITPVAVQLPRTACTRPPVPGDADDRAALRIRCRLPLPARGRGFRLGLDTDAFQLGDAPWTAAHACTRFRLAIGLGAAR